jgi:hypothetical protein
MYRRIFILLCHTSRKQLCTIEYREKIEKNGPFNMEIQYKCKLQF